MVNHIRSHIGQPDTVGSVLSWKILWNRWVLRQSNSFMVYKTETSILFQISNFFGCIHLNSPTPQRDSNSCLNPGCSSSNITTILHNHNLFPELNIQAEMDIWHKNPIIHQALCFKQNSNRIPTFPSPPLSPTNIILPVPQFATLYPSCYHTFPN